MTRFTTWIESRLGYLPRQADLARELGHDRGEIVRKWYAGIAYPNKENCHQLAVFMNINPELVQIDTVMMKIHDEAERIAND